MVNQVGTVDLSLVAAMSYEDLVAQLGADLTADEIENASMAELKASIGPLRIPVMDFAAIAKHAAQAGLSEANYVISLINDALGLSIPVTGAGRPKKAVDKDTQKAKNRLERARKDAMVNKILADLGAQEGE